MFAPSRRATTASLATLLAFTIALTGCFTTAADFREDAEGYIADSDDLRAALLDDGDEFVSATCAEPTSQDVGTTFACTARDSLDRDWEFEVSITDSNEYEVEVARFPQDG